MSYAVIGHEIVTYLWLFDQVCVRPLRTKQIIRRNQTPQIANCGLKDANMRVVDRFAEIYRWDKGENFIYNLSVPHHGCRT